MMVENPLPRNTLMPVESPSNDSNSSQEPSTPTSRTPTNYRSSEGPEVTPAASNLASFRGSGGNKTETSSFSSKRTKHSVIRPPTQRRSSLTELRASLPAENTSLVSRARPSLNRFHSMPSNPLTPLRQHFRLHSPFPHIVIETPNVAKVEDHRGKFINQYQITKVLGRGSFGIVYLAVDASGQHFALKECSKKRLVKKNRSELMRLRRQMLSQQTDNSPGIPTSIPSPFEVDSLINREIAIMKKLDHPNLVTLYEVLDNPQSESMVLVIEWCPGGAILPTNSDVRQRIAPIPEHQCRTYFRDLFLGVEYLHSRGICHRDIKADNVLLGKNDVVKISDFGVSELFDLEIEKGDGFNRPVGSPAYMSPELVRLHSTSNSSSSASSLAVTPTSLTSTRELDDSQESTNSSLRTASVSGRRADIWAMGVTLYFMASGQLPFVGDDLEQLYNNVLTTEPDYSMFSANLGDFLKRVLNKSPQSRLTLGEMRVHPWITENNRDPLLSEKENVANKQEDAITENDFLDAIDWITHQGHKVPVDYASLSRILRTNHGWHPQASSSECSSGLRTPRENSVDLAGSPSIKMEKLARALEEVLKIQERV